MNEKERNKISRFLSLVLRHKPGEIGIQLDEQGWADVTELIQRCAGKEKVFTVQDLEEMVATNDKGYGYWTAHGQVFDMGIATSAAIDRLERGVSLVLAGGKEEGSNGNGSLMRILPLSFYIREKGIEQRFEIVKKVSSLTHGHIRSVIACFLYLEMALEIINGKSKYDAYRHACRNCISFLKKHEPGNEKEYMLFARCFGGNIFELYEKDIHSSGYVVHTLEASIWCLLNSNNYADAVLKAANLGDDSDTTAAVTGGLAGLLYGYEAIPPEWLSMLARKADIEDLSRRLGNKLNKKWQEPLQ